MQDALLPRIGRVYDFIHDHLAEDLPVARLADVAFLSPWHFQRVFQQATGESAAGFVRRLRIERAANLLLLQRQATIGALAADCGFGSAELLARHFRERFGMSPSQWRENPPDFANSTFRQAKSTQQPSDATNRGAAAARDHYLEGQPQGEMSTLRLERRPERKVIYRRHFRGFEDGLDAAFEKVWHWAEPRGLIGPGTVRLSIGLDNPWVTALERCRSFACYTVAEFPEVGEGLGTRTIPGGLHALIDYKGPRHGVWGVYRAVYHSLLSRAGLEATEDVDYLEHRSPRPVLLPEEDMDCTLALPVRSL